MMAWYSQSSQRWLQHQMDLPENTEYVHPWTYYSYVRRHGIVHNGGVQVDQESNDADRPRDVIFIDLEGRQMPSRGRRVFRVAENDESLCDNGNRLCHDEGLCVHGESLCDDDSLCDNDEFQDGVLHLSKSASESESRGSLRESVIKALSESESRGSLRESIIKGLSDSRSEDEALRAVEVETHLSGGQLARTNQGEAVESTLSSIPFEVEGMMVPVWNQFGMLFNILGDKPLVSCIFLCYQLLKITNQMPNPWVYRWFILVYILLIFVFLMI